MLSVSEARQFSQSRGFLSCLALGGDWAAILALFALNALYPSWWLFLISFVLMARFQLALLILMHEATHYLLFQSRPLNNLVGQWFCGAPVFFSLYTYRRHHLIHHREPMAKTDPDLNLTGGYPISRQSFFRKIRRDLFGRSYLKFMAYYHPALSKVAYRKRKAAPGVSETTEKDRPLLALFSGLVMNGLVLLYAAFLGAPWLYLFLWWLPSATILQVLLRIRGITEHAGYGPNSDQRLNTRTVTHPLQTFLLAPHSVSYHIEHHKYPSVPFHQLKKVHRLMAERGSLPAQNVYTNYKQVLKELVR